MPRSCGVVVAVSLVEVRQDFRVAAAGEAVAVALEPARSSTWLYSSPFWIAQTDSDSFANGWCPPSTSMMLSRRTPRATPGSRYVPLSFGAAVRHRVVHPVEGGR